MRLCGSCDGGPEFGKGKLLDYLAFSIVPRCKSIVRVGVDFSCNSSSEGIHFVCLSDTIGFYIFNCMRFCFGYSYFYFHDYYDAIITGITVCY